MAAPVGALGHSSVRYGAPVPIHAVVLPLERTLGQATASSGAAGEGAPSGRASVDALIGELDELVEQLAPVDLVVVVARGTDLGGPVAGRRWAALPRRTLALDPEDARCLAVVAALARTAIRDLAVISLPGEGGDALAQATGAPHRRVEGLGAVLAAVASIEADRRDAAGAVGVGPHPEPWPDDARLDPGLLAAGDRRNVVDRYRYWREEAIVADLDRRRRPVHVAVENWQHDLNIGTVVRNANAFNVAAVHVIGKRRWNRRGAMATDRYLTVRHHPDVAAFAAWAAAADVPVVGIDNVPGAVDLAQLALPERCVLVFGQEGPGLSAEVLASAQVVAAIAQEGSTRSVNAGVASGIALYAWSLQHPGTPG